LTPLVVSRSPEIRTLQIADIELPPGIERLQELAYDLWWSWSPQAHRLFAWIDPEHWRRYQNPVQLLINVSRISSRA
jgi:glucan phosphorylase